VTPFLCRQKERAAQEKGGPLNPEETQVKAEAKAEGQQQREQQEFEDGGF
jgi:hypothetical protein